MTPLLEIIMSFIPSLPDIPNAWLHNSPLAPHLDAFAAHLADGGYRAQTTRNHFLGIAHFGRWMPTHKNSQIGELLPHRWQPTTL